MASAGTALLERNREAVDALNVFPVPDGDTGTNMSLTMQSAIREINSKEYLRADEAASALSKGALKGARGNSGVITSQLFRGFAKALKGIEKITPLQFAEALTKGAEVAYKAVMKPKEGTILTVAKGGAEKVRELVEKNPEIGIEDLLRQTIYYMEIVLNQTP
jgi:dihydroxyacetone kinase-like predicted kinase